MRTLSSQSYYMTVLNIVGEEQLCWVHDIACIASSPENNMPTMALWADALGFACARYGKIGIGVHLSIYAATLAGKLASIKEWQTLKLSCQDLLNNSFVHGVQAVISLPRISSS